MEHGVCIRVIGNLSLLPEDVQKLIAEAMLITRDNSKAALNIAFAYTCKDPNIIKMINSYLILFPV